MRSASIVSPAACLWPPNRVNRCAERSSAASMSKRAMLRHEPCATPPSTDSTMAGRWNASTSFDATIPMTPRCQPSPRDDQHRLRADVRVGLDDLLRGGRDRGFLFAPADVLAVELHGQGAGFLAHGFVARQQQPRRDVGRAHAAGGVDARGQHERDVVAVDGLPRQAGHIEQRSQADLVRPPREQFEADLGDHPVLAHERYDVGERPNGGDLDEPRQPAVVAGRAAERLHHLERDADAGQRLVGVACSRAASG